MKINIIKKEINKGIPRNESNCPVALAIYKAVKPYQVSVIDTTEVRVFWKENEYNIYPLPLKITKFIKRFDENKPVKPVSFILKI